jgi:D-inositol-3-phosphate glycosyltransferase
MTVIPPGVDSGRFLPIDQATARAELGLPEGDIIMYVGRLEPLKGVDTLLKAFSSIRRRKDRHLIIVGGAKDSPERVRLVNLASHLGISTRVKFVPSVDQSSLRSYYSAADVSVLPSHYESFGLAALEASACGTPVVASRVGGLATVIKNHETGFLVEQGQPDDLSRKLEILLRDEDLRSRMGATARLHAEKLSWAAAVDQLITLFTTMTCDPVSVGCGSAAG